MDDKTHETTHERSRRHEPMAPVTPPADPPHAVVATLRSASPEFTAPIGGVVEGRAYVIDGRLVIATATVGPGGPVASLTGGVVEYAKVHEQAWKSGDPVYWDAVGGCLSNVSASVDTGGSSAENVKVGVADKDAVRPSATGFVRLESAAH